MTGDHPSRGEGAFEPITRRTLLVHGGRVATAAAIAVRGVPGWRLGIGRRGLSAPVTTSITTRSAAAASLRTFAPLVGSRFELHPPAAHPVGVVLETAEPLPFQVALRGDAFTLVFHGPTAPRFSQDVMTISHEAAGAYRLFVVPVGWARQHQAYQVVVDRRALVRPAGYHVVEDGRGADLTRKG